MSSKTRLALITFVVGAGVGSCSIMVGDSGQTADDAVPAAPAPTATKTVIEHKYRDVESIPDSCMEVLNSLKAIKGSEDDLANVFIRGTDLLADGHEALTMKDGRELNEIREKLYKLDNKSNDSAQRLSLKLWPNLERNLKSCKATDAYKGGQVSQLEPRTYESDTNTYEISHVVPGARENLGFERVLLRVASKKTGNAWAGYIPVEDASVVGDLVGSVNLERTGFKRMEATPDELQNGDVIEGLGPIVEIEEIPGMTFDMIKVMVETIPKWGGDGTRGTASVLFSQVDGQWPSTVGITRPVKSVDGESH